MIKAKIYQPAKHVMQSGRGKTDHWILEFDNVATRAPEALMGWTSSDDTRSQVRLKFETLEDAKNYAEDEGLVYFVLPAHERIVKPRNYVDNFKYGPPKPKGEAVPEPKKAESAGTPKTTYEKKATEKKPAEKKPAAQKTTAKKPAAKKAAPKKTAAKKTATKKTAAKK